MRPGLWACAGLFVVVLGATACTSGLQGAAVGSQSGGGGVVTVYSPLPGVASGPTPPTQYGGAKNLLFNGSFEEGNYPWQPFTGSSLLLSHKPRRFNKTALLVKPTTFKPFGAQAEVIASPGRRTTYALRAWVKGSPSLVGGQITAQLYALTAGRQPVPFASVTQRVTGRWQRLYAHGKPTLAHASYLGVWIFATSSISLNGWFAMDGVDITQNR